MINPKINIIYIPQRSKVAQTLLARYVSLGANVNLLEVKDDEHSRSHYGKLYYFDIFPRFKEIAEALARSLRKVGIFKPQFAELQTEDSQTDSRPNFSIWIVKNPFVPIVSSRFHTPRYSFQRNQQRNQQGSLNHVVKENKLSNNASQIIYKQDNNGIEGSLATTVSGFLEQIEKSKSKRANKEAKLSNHKFIKEESEKTNRIKILQKRKSSYSNTKRCKHCTGLAMPGEDVCYFHIK